MPDEPPETEDLPPQIKWFSAFLQEQRGGLLHTELSDELAKISQAVIDTGKAGSVTLTVKIGKSKIDGAVEVEDVVKVRMPEPDRDAGLFFPDAHGNLSRRDPRQPELPGIRDVSATTKDDARKTGTEG